VSCTCEGARRTVGPTLPVRLQAHLLRRCAITSQQGSATITTSTPSTGARGAARPADEPGAERDERRTAEGDPGRRHRDRLARWWMNHFDMIDLTVTAAPAP
jgi:hypothetical protein